MTVTDPGIVLMPHTHWDREWYEPHDVFRLRLVHVLDDIVRRLETDPDFRFTLDGQTAAIEDYLEVRSENRDRIEALVRAGRLAIGPFLILLDEFCCDGETIVRNLELGIAGAERLGGAMPVGYLPDMFGHTAQMPQILKGFGIDHAALWRGVPAAVQEHAFAWSAPDGSVVRCEYLFDGYGSALDLFAVPGQLAELAAQYRAATRPWYGDDPVLGMYGTDHMAPAPDFMDRVREHNARHSADAPRMAVVTLAEYLRERDTDQVALDKLPSVRGELRSHARGNILPGVFSIRTDLKAAMAEAELQLTRAERLDALHSSEDHHAFFDLGWHRVVESSAHDSVTGCGVDATADEVANRLATAANLGRAVVERVAATLAQSVPSGAHLLVNTLPWARPVQAEVVVTADAEDAPPGTQLLGELETELGDEQMSSEDLVKILRRIHDRELFGQQIERYTWGQDSLHFVVSEAPEGVFDLARLTAEIRAVAEAPDTAGRSWRVLTTARRRSRILVEANVPPLGHVAVRPGESGGGTTDGAVVVDASRLSNGLTAVDVDSDGTLTLTGLDGTVLRGVARIVDEGDRGDAYNHGPTSGAQAVADPERVRTEVLAAGPLRGVIAVERTYRLPVALDPADRDRRAAETEELRTRMLVELRRHEPFVRLTLELVNTVRDHRLRLHVPLGERVEESFGAGQFDVTRRGRTAEGGWGEYPLPTFPATGFVSAGKAHVLLAKLTEYEVVTPPSGDDELALTLLRAVGLMSVNVHPLRDEPAGSEIPVPGAQYLGRAVTTRLAVLPCSGGWEAAGAERWAEFFRHDPVAWPGAGPSDLALPEPVSGPALTGGGVLTSLRSVRDAGTGEGILEARLVNLSEVDSPIALDPPPGRRWVETDLRGQLRGEVPPVVPGRSIRTLRTTDDGGLVR